MPDKEALNAFMTDFALRSAMLALIIYLIRMSLAARSGPLKWTRIAAEGSLYFFVGYGFSFLPAVFGWPPETGQLVGTIIALFGIDWMKEKLNRGVNKNVGADDSVNRETDY